MLEKSIRYSDPRFHMINHYSKDGLSEDQFHSQPHSRLNTMISAAQHQNSQLIISKWGLFARKLLIRENRTNVFDMLKYTRYRDHVDP